jgi:NADH:ubiquinone oxidoreductase subunit 3 (subunit A)
MKKLLEILVCFLHPLAVVLAWINLAGRSDLTGIQKLAWAVFMIVPVVPFVYVLTGGDLW